MTTTTPEKTPMTVATATKWLRSNLFDGVSSSLLTLITAAILGSIIYGLLKFVFLDAEWAVIDVNKRLIFLGRYPSAEVWRVWPPLMLLFALGGLSYGLLAAASRRDILWLSVIIVFIPAFLAKGQTGVLFAAAVALAIALYFLGRWSQDRPQLKSRIRRLVIVGWFLIIPFAVIIIASFGGVRPALWGGLLLNVLLAVIGIGVGLPLGILLALGRASSLPALKWVSTAIIEITRGGPLVAWLFISRFVFPEFIPEAINPDPIVSAMIIVSLFTGAYIAEIVRGGLQSVDPGQAEAAHALGLSSVTITVFIVLPQAIKAVIPALISQMISLWKDTTLFSVLSFTDALGGAQAAIAQPAFIGRQQEALLFIALLFWSGSLGMSRLSNRFERTLGIGER
jgi:general L-amino acid transport system permease protein